ncbi:hypothetical protein PR048_020709 [Dryococelus australis]|uniref:Uncharacterized protein n=1 Tax=Dryococelus australis TaxID=614101 RepID=A0ABQ9H783_9NEOP|nr:hypothetical protein PR048_020709 [Dryococelus australis]
MFSSLKLYMMLPQVSSSLKLHIMMQPLMSSSPYILKLHIVIVVQSQVYYPYCPNVLILCVSISHISHPIFDHGIKVRGSTISKTIGTQITLGFISCSDTLAYDHSDIDPKARGLLDQLSQGNVLFGIKITQMVFSLTKNRSTTLQSKTETVAGAKKAVNVPSSSAKDINNVFGCSSSSFTCDPSTHTSDRTICFFGYSIFNRARPIS